MRITLLALIGTGYFNLGGEWDDYKYQRKKGVESECYVCYNIGNAIKTSVLRYETNKPG